MCVCACTCVCGVVCVADKKYGFKLYSGFPEFIKIAVRKLAGPGILSLSKCLIPCGIMRDAGTLFLCKYMEILWIFKVQIKISVFCTVCHLLEAIPSKKCFTTVQGISEVFD